MRIVNIAITNLFGIFNHSISLNNQSGITIILGPNGYGKTILLRFLYSLLSENPNYGLFRRIPFEIFRVDFDDGSYLTLYRNRQKEIKILYEKNDNQYRFIPSRVKIEILPSETIKDGGKKFGITASDFKIFWNFIKHKNPSALDNRLTSFLYSLLAPDYWNFYDSLKKNSELSNNELCKENFEKIEMLKNDPNTFTEIRKISQLLPIDPILVWTENITPRENYIYNVYVDALWFKELKRSIKIRFFGVDRLNKNVSWGKSSKELNSFILALYAYDQKKLDPYLYPTQKIANIPEFKRYFQIRFQNQLNSLLEIINERMLFKQMEFNEKRGFFFITQGRMRISPEQLSSGERQLWYLYTELALINEPDTLVIIDEPELSLHISWQLAFLKDLFKLQKIGDFRALIATHSPEIIADRWDLVKELEGPKNAKGEYVDVTTSK